ncbi:NHS-like protein 1 [Sardina pilchardus]|uniref:NHS-like protein 1 n=1 Tax=Sardina pilchardus TaxID=27697 RepID=UPI002E0E0048
MIQDTENLQMIPDAENPLVIPDNETPLVILDRENPLVILDRENPLVIPDTENPVIILDRETPLVVPDTENPVITLDRENPLVVPDTENPVITLDRENPLVVPEIASVAEAVEKGPMCNGQSGDHVSEAHDESTGEPSVQPDDKAMSLESQSLPTASPVTPLKESQSPPTASPVTPLKESQSPPTASPVTPLKESQTPPMASPVTPRKEKPPVSPNKPKLSLFVPLLPTTTSLECVQVLTAESPVASSPVTSSPVASSPDGPPLFEVSGGQCFTLHQEDGEDSDSGSSTPMLLTQRRDSLSSELSSEGMPPGMHIQDLLIQEQDLGLSDERSTSDEDDQAASSGSSGSREEEQGVVADSPHGSATLDASSTSSTSSISSSGAHGDMGTPTRPRTTEDLFAVIHRSKRKVLGRGDCEELLLSSPSPPVTPTGSSPGAMAAPPPSLWLGRPAGSIQRSLRRSSTSSDSFKALLLKKGSRAEGSFRMSAAEMLKCTDPRKQRPPRTDASSSSSSSSSSSASSSESAQPPSSSSSSSSSPSHTATPGPVENGVSGDSSRLSPGRSRRSVVEEWWRTEGLTHHLASSSSSSSSSPGHCASSFSFSPTSPTSPGAVFMPPGKSARSRTPPSAASSRYNARGRIPSSPMTAICEREGELAEMSDGYEDQWEPSARTMGQHRSPFSLALSPGPTLCKGGSA